MGRFTRREFLLNAAGSAAALTLAAALIVFTLGALLWMGGFSTMEQLVGEGFGLWWLHGGVLLMAPLLVLLVWLIRLPRKEWMTGLGLGLILGGAVGNVADRIRLGYVVDFIDVHFAGWHYPAFNVADSAITCGVILLLLDVFLVSMRGKREE